mmetsp:Transcript_5222/g.13080  ORF Transcript_5222/g.13080 Transcript_5222/m.13080 type:complete len:206 (+) Transcript_5222:436-1053(+)
MSLKIPLILRVSGGLAPPPCTGLFEATMPSGTGKATLYLARARLAKGSHTSEQDRSQAKAASMPRMSVTTRITMKMSSGTLLTFTSFISSGALVSKGDRWASGRSIRVSKMIFATVALKSLATPLTATPHLSRASAIISREPLASAIVIFASKMTVSFSSSLHSPKSMSPIRAFCCGPESLPGRKMRLPGCGSAWNTCSRKIMSP